jgi:hypothetical protein
MAGGPQRGAREDYLNAILSNFSGDKIIVFIGRVCTAFSF